MQEIELLLIRMRENVFRYAGEYRCCKQVSRVRTLMWKAFVDFMLQQSRATAIDESLAAFMFSAYCSGVLDVLLRVFGNGFVDVHSFLDEYDAVVTLQAGLSEHQMRKELTGPDKLMRINVFRIAIQDALKTKPE